MTLPRFLLAVTAIVTFAWCQAVAAAPEDPAKGEIDHLLNYVATSSCTFVRNSTEYAASKARDHLAGKYQFAGSRVSSAEEFIQYLATQSSITGEPYHVKCGKRDSLAGAWLTEELHRYRTIAHAEASR